MTTRAEKIKTMDADEWVEIEHPETGERYGVKMSTYREWYEGKGFEVDRMADGSPILADSKEPDVPDDVQVIGVQGPEQPSAGEPVAPQAGEGE
jgi:hypothetical protein